MRNSSRTETTLLVLLAATTTVAMAGLWRRNSAGLSGLSTRFAPDGRSVVQAGRSGLQVVDIATGGVRCRFDRDHADLMLTGFRGNVAEVAVRRPTSMPGVATAAPHRLDLADGRLTPARLDADQRSVLAHGRTGVVAVTADGQPPSQNPLLVEHPDGTTVRLAVPRPPVDPKDWPMSPMRPVRLAFSDSGRTLAGLYRQIENDPIKSVVHHHLIRWDTRDGRLREFSAVPAWSADLHTSDGPISGGVGWSPFDGPTAPAGADLVWLSQNEGEVRTVRLPEGVDAPLPAALAPDGRHLAVVVHPAGLPPSSGDDRRLRRGRTGILVYDAVAGRLARRWDDRPPLLDFWALHLADERTLLAAGDRTGRLFALDLATGARTLRHTAPPPDSVGRSGWFPQAVLAVFVVWAILWAGRRRPTMNADAGKKCAGRTFDAAVLLVAGWAALRLLPEPLLHRSALLWTLLHRESTVRFPGEAHLVVVAVLATVVVAFAAAAAWRNRRRVGRLAWLTVCVAFVLATTAADSGWNPDGSWTAWWRMALP